MFYIRDLCMQSVMRDSQVNAYVHTNDKVNISKALQWHQYEEGKEPI